MAEVSFLIKEEFEPENLLLILRENNLTLDDVEHIAVFFNKVEWVKSSDGQLIDTIGRDILFRKEKSEATILSELEKLKGNIQQIHVELKNRKTFIFDSHIRFRRIMG